MIWEKYDNMERLLTASVERDGAEPVLLCSNTYDDLGRLATQSLGGTAEGSHAIIRTVPLMVTVVSQNGTLEETNSYYPYGMLHGISAIASTQPYKYTGKELDRENGLDWYDFEARMLMSDQGRTTTMDPLAEKYYSISPYAWCLENPIKFVDPTGNEFQIEGSIDNLYSVIDQIAAITPGILLYYTENNKRLTYSVVEKDMLDEKSKLLMRIIDDENIVVKIRTIDRHTYNLCEVVGGAFWGTRFNTEKNLVTTLNVVNPTDLLKIDKFSKMGTSIMHEISESYYAGCLSLLLKVNAEPAKNTNSFLQNLIYNIAHSCAIPQVPLYQGTIVDNFGIETESIFVTDESGTPFIIYQR